MALWLLTTGQLLLRVKPATEVALIASKPLLMLNRLSLTLFFFLFVAHGCFAPASNAPVQLKYRATGSSPQVIALYEAWFGHPRHISVGYSSQDPDEIQRQIKSARKMGITAFVVDWYGDREPFID